MGGFGLITAIAVIVLLLAAGAVYQIAGAARDARNLPPPGRMIEGLHASIEGAGRPPVVFEAGIAATSLSWRLVQPEIARSTQTISYDRAGLGWSDACAKPRLVWNLVDELRQMLQHAGVPAPRVLVAHSFGGLIALAYAARFPSEIAGMVLVDPVGISEWADPGEAQRWMHRRGLLLSRFGEVLARLGVVRFALDLVMAGSQRIPRMIARASSGRSGAAFTERMAGEIRKLPREIWPAIQSHWCDPKCFRAMRGHIQALPESARAVLQESIRLEIPLMVLSAGNSSAAQRADHERFAALSSRGTLDVVDDSGHWIMLDRPEVVIRAIHRVISGILGPSV